jgi:acyl-CoA synthetase (AMP-forming)/AMP-acid ligase II
VNTVLQTLRRRASHTPERVLFTFADYKGHKQHLTYAELVRRAAAMAATLQSHIAPGDRVIVALAPGLDYAASLFGVLLAGAVAVPAYPPGQTIDCRRLRQLEAIATDCAPKAIITEAMPDQVFDEVSQRCAAFRAALQIAPRQVAAGVEHFYAEADVRSEDLALLQYTSGSTGSPKGVMISHGNLFENVGQVVAAGALNEDDIQVLWLPPYHDMGLIGGLFSPLHAGFHSILTSPLFFLKRPLDWLRLMSREQASVTAAPTFAYAMAAQGVGEEQVKDLDLSHVRIACVSAEPVREAALSAFAKCFAPAGFDPSAFVAAYGLAEHTVLCASAQLGRGVEFRRDAATPNRGEAGRAHANCGRPVRSSEIVIVNPDTLSPCPDGQSGEIWVRGPSVAAGYWKKPAVTRATFDARIEGADGRFLRTGDLGCLRDGELFVFGRLSDKLIVHGRNIHAEDIESCVLAARPDTSGAAAFGVAGEGAEMVIVLVETGPYDSARSFERLVEDIRRAVRRSIEVELDVVWLLGPRTLPRTDSGKIRRRDTRSHYLNGGFAPRRTWSALDGGEPNRTGAE